MGPAAPRAAGRPPAIHRLAPPNAGPPRGIVLAMEHTMNYIETEAPAGLTLVEWSRTRVLATPRRRRIRLSPPRIRTAFAF
jgi:hypothetical protein